MTNARLPIYLVSSNQAEKLCDKWVQTRGYLACVVYMPIPLRVCLAKAPMKRKSNQDDLPKLKKEQTNLITTH